MKALQPNIGRIMGIRLRDGAISSKQSGLSARNHIDAFKHAVEVDLHRDCICLCSCVTS